MVAGCYGYRLACCQWLQCLSVVIVCCPGYSLLPWLQCASVVTVCCRGYGVLSWLQGVVVLLEKVQTDKPVWAKTLAGSLFFGPPCIAVYIVSYT